MTLEFSPLVLGERLLQDIARGVSLAVFQVIEALLNDRVHLVSPQVVLHYFLVVGVVGELLLEERELSWKGFD